MSRQSVEGVEDRGEGVEGRGEGVEGRQGSSVLFLERVV